MDEYTFITLKRLVKDEKGQGLIEYAMILFFAVIILVVIITGIGQNLNTKYELINSKMP